MSKGPGPISGGMGCGILLAPVVFLAGGWGLGKVAELLTWIFG